MRGRFDDLIADNATIRKALKLDSDIRTLSAALTVLDDSPVFLQYDAGGSSRNVTFPARALTNDNRIWVVHNISTAGENLVLKDSSATTILTLPSSGVALVMAFGTSEAPGTRGLLAVPLGGEDLALADALTVTGASLLNGNVLLGATSAKSVGAYGFSATQPTSANQAAVSSATISGIVLSATQTSAWGVQSSTQLTNLVTAVNDSSTRALALVTLVNQLRADLVTTGWIKGS